MLRFRWTR